MGDTGIGGGHYGGLRPGVHKVTPGGLDLLHRDGGRIVVIGGVRPGKEPRPVVYLPAFRFGVAPITEGHIDVEQRTIQALFILVVLSDCQLAYGVTVGVGFLVADLGFGLGIGGYFDVVFVLWVFRGFRNVWGISGIVSDEILRTAAPFEVIVFEVAVIASSFQDLICGILTRTSPPGNDGGAHKFCPDTSLSCGIVSIAFAAIVIVGQNLLNSRVVSSSSLNIFTFRALTIPLTAKCYFAIQGNSRHGTSRICTVSKGEPVFFPRCP